MTAMIMDGKSDGRKLCRNVADEAKKLLSEYGDRPGLAVILVSSDPASEI